MADLSSEVLISPSLPPPLPVVRAIFHQQLQFLSRLRSLDNDSKGNSKGLTFVHLQSSRTILKPMLLWAHPILLITQGLSTKVH